MRDEYHGDEDEIEAELREQRQLYSEEHDDDWKHEEYEDEKIGA